MTSGRRVLVTGASSGIGEAVARLAAARGDRVALLARRADELERVRRSLERRDEHVVLTCDLRDEAAVRAALAEAGRAFGALDLVVHSAGIGYRARLDELETRSIDRVLAINVTAVLCVNREALPWLERGDQPVVVHVGSVIARRGIPGQLVYAASKAALASASEALRLEWAPRGIQVCLVHPGVTRTPFFDVQENPHQRPPPDLAHADTPEQVARVILDVDRRPRPEVWLRSRWRWFAIAGLIAPKATDRWLARKLGPPDRQ
ncbi:MAG: SDR family oxidoreductase [Planctomycetes bacterium]|nr:SDR family oxidoreductase [Planctomycetota bacterium]